MGIGAHLRELENLLYKPPPTRFMTTRIVVNLTSLMMTVLFDDHCLDLLNTF